LYGSSNRRSESTSRIHTPPVIPDILDQPHQIQYIPGHGYFKFPIDLTSAHSANPGSAQLQPLQISTPASNTSTAVAEGTRANLGPQHHITLHKEAETARAIRSQSALYHICATCGRRRSPRYHYSHPTIQDKAPLAGICRRCQSEDTSSEEDFERSVGRGKHDEKRHSRRKNRRTNSIDDSSSSFSEKPPSEESFLVKSSRRHTSRRRSSSLRDRIEGRQRQDQSISRARARGRSDLRINVDERDNEGLSRRRESATPSIHSTFESQHRDSSSESNSIKWTIQSPVSSAHRSHRSKEFYPEQYQKELPNRKSAPSVERSHNYQSAKDSILANSTLHSSYEDIDRPDYIIRTRPDHHHISRPGYEHENYDSFDHTEPPRIRGRSQSTSSYTSTLYSRRRFQYFDQEDEVCSGHIRSQNHHHKDNYESGIQDSLRARLRALKDNDIKLNHQDSSNSTTVNVGGNKVIFGLDISKRKHSPARRASRERTRYRGSDNSAEMLEYDEYESPSGIFLLLSPRL
jgi:hypothetical protein